ncbi:uncharacterized protein Z518_05781 [Rhinocladiella mackenziei CBS 650.93]|uniref:Rhinocladiella mackenziei CBS 650.93 unplaced genomic scaffold supercont1.4, whole genome shotgun sequence n=1 Tax=Rhinocladiella mackenziei CBS 650.93 TaxID=1442369 RepID=A0A0D2J744_9EURO|nr:uncharacterized protein Z518_05781 [Rhinocladiella mackenziei CBS 650.93]KIX04910.1 hypothetical protein Z518_05781 [Rhinocladiella mackenziei CBS 650.93]
MTKKKPKTSAQSTDNTPDAPIVASQQTPPSTTTTAPPAQESARPVPPQELKLSPSLVISRNKHWRHISSYHGPWLNFSPDLLENLACSNFYSPRPRPVDPAVFFDLVKIRRLIEDATSLAVRAANGTTSASLHTSLNATNGLFSGIDAEILGIGSARGGGNAKLSRERKYRMREHATQKLSHAYHLDEIAASVATMQSASALEEVANYVLQRNDQDPDAQYVHFFLEKIPSMSLAQCTSLDALTHVIRSKPTEASPYRTRAVTRCFKEDWEGAIRDCTDGLTVLRLYHSQRQNQQRELVGKDRGGREHRADNRVDEKDQPSSLEPQLLFHRATAYLMLACEAIERALDGMPQGSANPKDANGHGEPEEGLPVDTDRGDAKYRAEQRKLVRTYAKRALRDYLSFLSNLDYTPGLPAEYTDVYLERLSQSPFGRSRGDQLLALDAQMRTGLTEVLAKYERERNQQKGQDHSLPQIPNPVVYRMSDLFAAAPPADLPPYPPAIGEDREGPIFSLASISEAVTYHPLLTDTLHSLLICHCLIQTSPKEHLRHAYMAARINRLCDGYPVFLAARSPARADWIEITRLANNWLGLSYTWESLATPDPVPSNRSKSDPRPPKEFAMKEGLVRAAMITEPLTCTDEGAEKMRHSKLPDNNTMARNGSDGNTSAHSTKRWQLNDGREYPITTERAEAIVRWILEAPPPNASDGSGRPKKKSGTRKTANTSSSLREPELEQSVDSLDLVD